MDIFNNLWVINECLLDAKRTRSFEKAINQTVKPTDIVLDAGTGTGILALFSARAGAKKVFAVDIAEDTLQQARSNIQANPYSEKITLIQADLKKFDKVQHVDILTMEMLDTGLVSEQQATALNRLRRNGVIDDHTQLIPFEADCYIELIEFDYNFYGMYMPCIITARNFGVNEKVKKLYTKTVKYAHIDFRKPIQTIVDSIVSCDIEDTGKINALRLKTRISLTKTQKIWGTSDMNMPIIVPLEEKQVVKGEQLRVRIQYAMGEGFATFSATYS